MTTTHRRLRFALLALTTALPALLAGCGGVDNHPTATGKTVEPPETRSVEDPGKVNAGGPGAQGQLPK
jgi:hypothetical protein